MMETINLESLSELDRLISEKFNLPIRPYSSDLRAALELAVWQFDNSSSPHFEIFRSGFASEEEPFLASFEPDAWLGGETAPLAICKSALFYLKKTKVILKA